MPNMYRELQDKDPKAFQDAVAISHLVLNLSQQSDTVKVMAQVEAAVVSAMLSAINRAKE